MGHPGTRYLTPRELDQWYAAINAVRGSKPHRYRLPVATPVQVSRPISLRLTAEHAHNSLRIPLRM